ncbi:caspase family protein [Taklimakanibacter deserti]|uniref:caspase family protein n=1 Tax=Taklimakanibacter deserti TaxID=2267839 RepID=UPI000E65D73D
MFHPVGNAIRRMTATFSALLLVALFANLAAAQDTKPLKGVALIIGQSRYEQVTPLVNPANDARAVDGLLTGLGFDTRTVSDRDAEKLKRDLERFAEDAEGADVALLYYSGHGIEAGGENYLVPTDADLSALDDAGERLVPLSAIMERLKRSVPITILLLDACRTNPFPADATLKVGGESPPAPVAAIGLGAPRGMSVVEDPAATDNLGMVIGLAAEPGRAALDGEPGRNSPYAAALIRHLSAIKGEEFGTVMRLVTEEVYLTTRTRQRPWINESLRRLLYFGGAPQEAEGPSGLITQERRHLLLTITALPEPERKQVETIAEKDGVPLDALYGILRALGAADIPKDPAALEKFLRAQAASLKQMIAEREALKADNPEIARLTAAADQAIREGAIETARQFLDQAVKIVEENRVPVDAAEAPIKARRIADAQVYARRAEAERLALNVPAAAEDYDRAYALIAKWDDTLAWRYKFEAANVLSEYGDRRGDTASLARAIAYYETALAEISRETVPEDWAHTQNNLGIALHALGDRETGSDKLYRAATAFIAALVVLPRDSEPIDWGLTQNNLGNVLHTLGEREVGTLRLEEAVRAYDAALETLTRAAAPLDWSSAQNNLGNVLHLLGERRGETALLREAAVAYRAAMDVRTRDEMPLQWGVTQSNLGMTLRIIGERESGTLTLEESIATYRLALEELKPDLAPADWAMAQSNLGNALASLGRRENDLDRLEEAVVAYRGALGQRSREQVPYLWAMTQNNLAGALAMIGERGGGVSYFEEAAAAYRAALEERTRERLPREWALTQSNLGAVLQMLGEARDDVGLLAQAAEAHRSALLEFTRERAPQEWSKVQNNLGNALRSLGEREKGTASLKQALVALTASLEERSREASPHQWANTKVIIGLTSLTLAHRGGGRKMANQAIAAFEAAQSVYREANALQNVAQVEGFLKEARAVKR